LGYQSSIKSGQGDVGAKKKGDFKKRDFFCCGEGGEEVVRISSVLEGKRTRVRFHKGGGVGLSR